jgi:hypothetical protein
MELGRHRGLKNPWAKTRVGSNPTYRIVMEILMKKPRVGSKMVSWFSGKPDGLSNVLMVYRYTGRYNFKYVVRLTAPNTVRGWMEVVV